MSKALETFQLALSRENIQCMEDAENRGIEKGSHAKMVEMVLRLHKKSTPLSEIAEVTHVAIEEIQKIIEKQG